HPDLQITEISTGVGFDSGARVADEVIAAGATAALAFNDLVAMGLLSALAARGIRVPDDISVTGFDDIPFAAYTTPPLTTATVPSAQLGRDAWAAMRALLEGESVPESTLLTPEITVRESTGPAPTSR
ncbi:MAG: substrate-binding domain-containing protein, partial [Gemmatimonadales bacterium]|nr:substrate-binding domain-containing protein [Gemmatimonadales bacterium]